MRGLPVLNDGLSAQRSQVRVVETGSVHEEMRHVRGPRDGWETDGVRGSVSGTGATLRQSRRDSGGSEKASSKRSEVCAAYLWRARVRWRKHVLHLRRG